MNEIKNEMKIFLNPILRGSGVEHHPRVNQPLDSLNSLKTLPNFVTFVCNPLVACDFLVQKSMTLHS